MAHLAGCLGCSCCEMGVKIVKRRRQVWTKRRSPAVISEKINLHIFGNRCFVIKFKKIKFAVFIIFHIR